LAFEYVPSVHFAVAPVGSVLPVGGFAAGLAPSAPVAGALPVAAGAEPEPAAGVLAAVEEAGGALEVAGALEDAVVLELAADEGFCTPPWPLQAPRPVAVEVVPSLHVVGAGESAAQTAWLQARINNGTAATRASAWVGIFLLLGWAMSRVVRQQRDHVHEKARMVVGRRGAEQLAIDAHVRILHHVLREFGDADQL
jgi:hypothetical protein